MLNRHLRPTLLVSCIALVLLAFVLVGLQVSAASSSTVLISAVYYDAYLPNQPEESFRLTNVSATPVNLTNWQVTDGEGVMTLAGSLAPYAARRWMTYCSI